MGLFGAPEVAALSYDRQHNRVCGVRLKAHKRGRYIVVRYASSEHAEWQQAANRVLKDLGGDSSVYLLLCMALENSDVFECEMPEASPDVMRSALRFEVPQHVMQVPEEFALQYVSYAHGLEEGVSALRCAVVPDDAVHKFCNQLAGLRKKPDAVIHPLLTLPGKIAADETVQLAGFEEGFCWRSGAWQLAVEGGTYNQSLDKELHEHCIGKLMSDENFDIYRTALTGALFGIGKLFVKNNILGGVTILPAYMRPARYRTQLRLMAVLVIALLGLAAFRYGGGVIEKYSSYNKLSRQVASTKRKAQELRKKVKKGDKEVKELQRMADLKVGSRECVGILGYMSDRLPDSVMVQFFRYNEGTVDMNMMSSSTDLDLVDFFNRLPGFTVNNAAPRNLPNGISASVKLTVFDPEAEQAKARRKAREKTKNKSKGKK